MIKIKLAVFAICALSIMVLPNSLAADDSYSEDGFLILGQDDLVGITFWIATAAMLGSSIFFLIERMNVLNWVPVVQVLFLFW